ncbi:MAG: acyltransferase domain-containing protein, partial [Aquisalimonadaceae bacterium]
QPAFVLGHSVGEFAAATFAGVLTFEDGLRLVAQRASSMQACRADGAMTAVQTDRRSASAVLERLGSGAVIAAVNSPRNVVLSGPVSDIEAAEQVLNAQDVPHRRLEVSHAFHSRAMAPAAHTLRDFATQVPHGPATLPMVSSTTGAVLTDDVVWPDYWADQLLKPVEFDLAVTRLAQEKPDLVLEVGPRPVLSRLVHGRFGAATRVYNTLNPVSDDLTVVLRALGACFEAGVDLRAAAIHPADGTPRLRLPGYAFEPQRHRLYAPVRMPRAEGSAAAAGLQHAFLADATVKSTDQNGFSVSVPIGTRRFAYLGDHTVFGADVLPATGHIGLAQAAAYQITGNRHWRLQDLEFRRPLVLEADDRRVRVDVIADSDAQFRFLVIDDDGQPTPSVSSRSVYSCGVLTACPPMEEESA